MCTKEVTKWNYIEKSRKFDAFDRSETEMRGQPGQVRFGDVGRMSGTVIGVAMLTIEQTRQYSQPWLEPTLFKIDSTTNIFTTFLKPPWRRFWVWACSVDKPWTRAFNLFLFLVELYWPHRNFKHFVHLYFTISLSSYWYRIPVSKGDLSTENITKSFLSSRQASNK